ncbi:MAG: helix-turn-helix domain-containing protein [Kiritimatiellae bacterium]|nr:helix-turn-helix domain-containing protein [Kiritimatiellia bacterium]
MALGKTLKNAREAMGLSPTDVAEQTNMMVQIVEELENENFHRIAAPIYGRGFLKLYAELLGIDPQPLIDEFMDICSGKIVPELRKRELDGVPAQEKPPVPLVAPVEEISAEPEVSIPQRVDVTPHQAIPSLDGIPRPLRKAGSLPVEPIITVEESTQKSAPDIKPEPRPIPESDADSVQEEQGAPKPGSALFDSDEPNLFNTTPLQERVAEARRLMEEEQSTEPEAEKKSPLHFGSNTTLPIFQIGGRMDESYASVPRQTRARSQAPKQRSTRWDGFARFFTLVRAYLPFEINQKSLYVYGLLGLIVIAFLSIGITALFKLTGPGEGVKAEPAAVVEKKVEAPPPKPVTERQVPPPPDMYFD